MEKRKKKLNSLTFTKKKKDMSFLNEIDFVFATNLELIICQKCNLACEHCMRGEGSSKVISDEVLDATFQKFNYIDNLALGGGDPSLVPEIINNVSDAIIRNKTIVKHINLTTNGVQVSDEFIKSLQNLRDTVKLYDDKESLYESDMINVPIIVCFSMDEFHLKQIIKQGYTFDDIYKILLKFKIF